MDPVSSSETALWAMCSWDPVPLLETTLWAMCSQDSCLNQRWLCGSCVHGSNLLIGDDSVGHVFTGSSPFIRDGFAGHVFRVNRAQFWTTFDLLAACFLAGDAFK